MSRTWIHRTAILTLSATLLATGLLHGATIEQRKAVNAIEMAVNDAAKLFLQRKFQESAEAIRQVEEDLQKVLVGADRETINLLKPQYDRLKNAHIRLELEGYSLPKLVPLEPISSDPAEPDEPMTAGVSFKKDVVPILVAKCGRCHIEKSSGELSMATYEDLLKGSSAGTVVFPGDPVGSELIVTIEEGDMPRGGLKITGPELATLKEWIAEGAKFDGSDPKANIAAASPVVDDPVAGTEMPLPTGSGGVSFARHIAPILIENCSGCHVNADQLRGGLNMTTFAGLMRGGDSEPPVNPGDPAGSLLVRKLKGTAGGQRMPPGGPLPETAIAKIEKWIEEGAKFDGTDPNQSIEQLANFVRAQLSTPEQLSADREEAAMEDWNLAVPGIRAQTAKTDNFFLIGDVGERALAKYGEQAESVLPKVVSMLDATQPLIKGRMTLFVFRQRYDYSEFGRMIERHKPPIETRGHWRYNLVDAYGAMIAPSNEEEYSTEVLIGQQIAGVYTASIGKGTPRWFAEGVAREVASRLAKDDPRVLRWNEDLPAALQQITKAEDLVTDKLPPEIGNLASYSYVKFLMGKARQFKSLMTSLRQGENFEQAFSAAYGGSPLQMMYPWVQSVSRRR